MNLHDLPFPVFGDTTFRGKCAAESVEQVTFFNRLRAQYPDTWGALAIHARNEQQLRGGQFGGMAKQKAEGMVSGASDIIIPARVTLVIELKRWLILRLRMMLARLLVWRLAVMRLGRLLSIGAN